MTRTRIMITTSVTISTFFFVGCGAAPTPSASLGTTSTKTATKQPAKLAPTMPSNLWHVVGTLAAQDSIVGKEAGLHHLWFLTQLPATANHGPEYQGQSVETTSHFVTSVTPPFLPPDNRSVTAWGRTAHGLWWITFVSQNDVVRTVTWKPGQSQWNRLPNITIKPPSPNDFSRPVVYVIRGRAGHGWLVSNYVGTSGGAQTIVYDLDRQGWHVLHAFPLASNSQASNITWQIPGPPGTLYVNPQGPSNPVLLSRNGSILKTLPIPQTIITHLSHDASVHVAMSNSGISYATGASLWQWKGTSVQSLISPGSVLYNNYTWVGFWQNQPVVSEYSASPMFLYHHGQWIAANVLKPPASIDYTNFSFWKGHTLWWVSQNTGKIWTKTVSSSALP